MAIYRPSKGSKVWWYDFIFEGQRVRETAKTRSKTLARDAERARRRELEESYNGIKRRDRAKLTPDRVAYFCHPDWVARSERAPPPDLWRPRIDTDQGLAATAAWYREQHWL